MARTVPCAAAPLGLPVFSAKCATHAVEVICRICAHVSPSRSGSGALDCAGLPCDTRAGASTTDISKVENNLIPEKPPANLLRTRVAHLEEIELLLQAAQHFIINLIVVAHVQQS